MTIFYVAVFLLSALVLAVAGNWLVDALARIARLFGWREFIAAFFIMSVAVSVPEFLIGVTSALRGIPELSFGNIIGANVVHFTLSIALAALVLGGIRLHRGQTVWSSTVFTIFIALLPIFLISDGILSRIDGVVLIGSFIIYALWIFSKKEHFKQIYNHSEFSNRSIFEKFHHFLKNFGIIFGGTILLIAATEGIVRSATFFADALNVPLVIVGILVIGLGTALPETYFSIASARRGHTWMIVGNLMGSTVVTASLVLGIVALINPIVVTNFSPYVVSRLFLLVSALVFLFFFWSGGKITTKESLFLLFLYIAFVYSELSLCRDGAHEAFFPDGANGIIERVCSFWFY